MTGKIAGVSDEAVVDATGEPWAAWIDLLDELDGTDLTHGERVAALANAGVESGWWRQKLAVGYEHERGLREVGETADAGYQVGVQRTLAVPAEELWALLTSPAGLAAWLGEVETFAADPGEHYETADGTAGEVRTVAEGERLRLTWQPPDREAATTLQVTLGESPSGGERTVLRVHHERLADATEREAMRDHWRAVLDRIEATIEA